jgi:hypothetical protein
MRRVEADVRNQQSVEAVPLRVDSQDRQVRRREAIFVSSPAPQLDIASLQDRDDPLGSTAGHKPDANPHPSIPKFQEWKCYPRRTPGLLSGQVLTASWR